MAEVGSTAIGSRKMTSRGHSEKRKRTEESVSGLTKIKKKKSGEDARRPEDEEPRPGTSQDPRPSGSRFDIERFTGLQVLGRGGFGKVVLASVPERNTFLAIKVINRSRSEADIIMRERRTLVTAQGCPFICHLYTTQQSAERVYFITEYLAGGTLASMIKTCGHLDIDNVIFYTAEIVSGLQFLHGRGIVHRDIKPDNIMLDSAGHIRLIDLGLAQDGVTSSNKISGVTGTLHFMAPEILLGQEYDTAVDWWSLGIVVSCMAAGESPFYHGTIRGLVIRSITTAEPNIPSWLDAEVKHLLQRLLCKDPEKRLGVCDDIRAHPFFTPIDWEPLERRRLRPHFKPFCSVPENRNLLWLEDNAPLHPVDGFSYTSPSWNRMTRRFQL